MGKKNKKNPHIGSRLDDFLKEEGIFDELQAQAINEVANWQRGKPCESPKSS